MIRGRYLLDGMGERRYVSSEMVRGRDMFWMR